MKKTIGFDKMTLGVCYYPEHWDKSIWDDDLARMEEYGIEIIRIAEFAWNIIEPQEGIYSFDFFDEFLEHVKKHKIKVIFGTPTATPPAWLTEKYPEVLNAACDGTLFRHGMRRNYNYNSPVYNVLTRKIVTQLAKHYGHHEAIVGWQIDNELNCEVDEFYSESDHKAFREFLKNKYGTLKSLNAAWGTNFWSQEYTDWEQVFLKRPNACNSSNPHLALDEKRFFSYSCIRYCKLQYDILRQYIDKDQFVTTNGMFGHLDSHEMTAAALDFFMYDSYPNFGYSSENTDEELKDRKWSYNLSKVRSVSPNFGIMEQQSGPNGWVNRMMAASPKPGQMKLWTFQSVAHGADYISYFRWRTCYYGTEIYWHGINDYSNIPNRRVEELKQIHNDFLKLTELPRSQYKADFALVRDYDNEWDGELDKWHGPLEQQSTRAWFMASTYTHTPMDVLQLCNSTELPELQQYKMLIYPHATILTEKTADLLKAYVEDGGILIVGARTGYKDEFGRCPTRPMPGFAGEFCGTRVKDFTIVLKNEKEVHIETNSGTYNTVMFNDILEVTSESASIIGRYRGGYYDGEPAVIENSYGRGKAVYFGSVFTQEIARNFLSIYALQNLYQDILVLPECCELAIREKDDKKFFFVLNYSDSDQPVLIKRKMKDLLTDKVLIGETILEKYGVLVLEFLYEGRDKSNE